MLGHMSNSSLIAKIETSLESVRSGNSTAKSFAETVRSNGRALEGMPYALIKEFESIAMDLEVASWQDEDGFIPNLESVLIRTDSWLQKLPRDM